MTSEDTARVAEAAAEAVREASGQGRLATLVDVLAALEAEGLLCPKEGHDAPSALPRTEVQAALAGILCGHPDIAAFQGQAGETLYHAPALLSRTYAGILDRKGSPLTLMAEEIRANSRDYPRPVPVELFEAPPFDLSPEAIGQALQAMAADADYQDITFTTAPSGAVFLFSSLHLERGYAEFLAQRAESLAANP